MTTEEASVDIFDVEEHDDGSATITFDLKREEEQVLFSLGVKFLLTCVAADLTTDQALAKIMEINGE